MNIEHRLDVYEFKRKKADWFWLQQLIFHGSIIIIIIEDWKKQKIERNNKKTIEKNHKHIESSCQSAIHYNLIHQTMRNQEFR